MDGVADILAETRREEPLDLLAQLDHGEKEEDDPDDEKRDGRNHR